MAVARPATIALWLLGMPPVSASTRRFSLCCRTEVRVTFATWQIVQATIGASRYFNPSIVRRGRPPWLSGTPGELRPAPRRGRSSPGVPESQGGRPLRTIEGLKYLLAPIVAWTICQVAKVTLTSVRQHRLNLRVLAETGGMPSSHSAIVAGLATAIGKYAGVTSPQFAIALIFSFVVMYDAAGLRRAAGRQAAVLNRLVEDLVHMRGVQEPVLRELLGHTPFEVLVGAAIGIGVGLIL